MWPFKKKTVSAPPSEPEKPVVPAPLKVSDELLAMCGEPPRKVIERYEPPRGVIPDSIRSAVLAMDATPYDDLNAGGMGGVDGGFPGYAYLSLRATMPENRKMSGVLAEEMTRKWIKIKASGDDKKADKVKAIIDAVEQFKLRDHFKKAIEHDGFFGRGQIYIDVKTPRGITPWTDPVELESALFISPKKITKGSLVGFRVIEPMWTYPGIYNSDNPLSPDFYKPAQWYVMGKTVHASRMMDFISRPVPDIIKAAFNFGGISLTQLAEPYVNNWLRTRDSISDMVHSFSTSGLATNMASSLSGAVDPNVINRAKMFNRFRDNRGLMLVDKATEEFFQHNTPLSGLDALQAQAMEHLFFISGIPAVKFAGLSPVGLNASSEGEIKVFYDFIKALQMAICHDNLQKALNIIQLHLFGEIDTGITFEFESLHEMTDEQKSTIRKTNAETDQIYQTIGAISSQVIAESLAADPDNPYSSLELDDGIEIGETDEENDDWSDSTGSAERGG